MKIQLQRHIGYHLVQTYIPSVVFVILSWLALFISADSIPGKFLLIQKHVRIVFKNPNLAGIKLKNQSNLVKLHI